MTTNSPAAPIEQHDREPDEIRWTLLGLDELVEVYWNVIAPAFERAGHDPETERPTHAWLSDNGFRGLVYSLREYHDRTFGEFWADDLQLSQNEGYEWGIDHEETIALLEAYLDSRRKRGNLSPSSEDTLRYRLASYVRAYATANETPDLVTPVSRDTDIPAHEAVDAAWAAIDRLDSKLAPQTIRRVHEAAETWYAHLVRRKRAIVNPVSGLEEEYRWSRRTENEDGSNANTPTNPALSATHVQALSRAAETTAERMLVIALCAWGLRSGEVATLHRSQLVFGEDVDLPHVTFDERKNGPGEVSVLFGQDVATLRCQELTEQGDWNGYLFPSQRSNSGHISRRTVLNRFDTLAERANLDEEIGGHKPVPQMGRRFWYDAYTATHEQILDDVGEIAAEQGSSSASVVLDNYLSAERRRKLRRESMRKQLATAFDGDSS